MASQHQRANFFKSNSTKSFDNRPHPPQHQLPNHRPSNDQDFVDYSGEPTKDDDILVSPGKRSTGNHQIQNAHFTAAPISTDCSINNADDFACRPNIEAAAASFFAKATQKVAKQAKTRSSLTNNANNLTSNCNSSSLSQNYNHESFRMMSPQIRSGDEHPFPSNYGLSLANNPPSAPPGLFRNVERRTSTAGKLKVALRLSPENKEGIASPNSFVSVDDRRKQILLKDTRHGPNEAANAPPKMFAFDHVFAEDAAQAEICASTLPEVLQSVINGNDGCVFGFGNANLGKTFTMVGEDTSLQTIGVIPCAISWLFRLINDQKQKSGAKFSVRVSSVEIHGKDEHVRDLLADQDNGGSFFSSSHESPGIFLQPRDGSGSFSLQNHSELRAATADKAAFYLDAALAARTANSKELSSEETSKPSHMIFTMHIYQYRVDRSKKNGVCGGRSRLHLIDVGNCEKPSSVQGSPSVGSFLSYSALGNVLLALMNGSRHVPHRDSKLTQMLREIIGGGTCCTVMIAHVSCQPEKYDETLNTVQLAHKLHKTKKRKSKSSLTAGIRHHSSSGAASSSSEYSENSSCDELGRSGRRMVGGSYKPMQGSPKEQNCMSSDYSSSSEQSCDTVIYRGPDGRMLSDSELTDNERPPQFPRVVSSANSGVIDKINRPSNMFKPIKEAIEECDSKDRGSRAQSDSEIGTRNSSFKMSKLNRYSPKCSTPAESDQEGIFIISKPSTISGTRRSNSVGEESSCTVIPENQTLTNKMAANSSKCESNGSLCSACNVSYENSSMFHAQSNTCHNSLQCKHSSLATSDSSFENIPGLFGGLHQTSTSPNRGVVSDTEVMYNAPRGISKPRTGSNLSFISEEMDVQNQVSQPNGPTKHARFVVSAHNLANNAVKSFKPPFVKDFKASSKKATSSASFFKEPPAENDVWQVREASNSESCQDSQQLKLHCGMSDGKRMQSTAMLVAFGPQAMKMCTACTTGRCLTHESKDPRSPKFHVTGVCHNPSTGTSVATPPKTASSKKSSILSKFRRSRTPEQTPRMKSKRLIRSPKSRSSQPSPSRKTKIKVPVLDRMNNRTPENSPPRSRKATGKDSISSQSSCTSSNDCEFMGFSRHIPRYAYSDSEDVFMPQNSDSGSIPFHNLTSCDMSTPSHESYMGDTTPTQVSANSRINVTRNHDSPQQLSIHQYETLDRVGSNQKNSSSFPDKAMLIQKFSDARVSKCHVAPHPVYRLSSYTNDSGLESLTSDGVSRSSKCQHPDLIESHCPPQCNRYNQIATHFASQTSCPCRRPSCTEDPAVLNQESGPNDLNSSRFSDLNSMNSVPCSPFTCSKKGSRPKRSKSADRKSGGRGGLFHLSSMFSLRSRKSKNEDTKQSESERRQSKSSDILSDSAPSQRTISILNPDTASKPAPNVARVPPLQRLPPPVVSPGSGITIGTDSDSGIELSSQRHRRHYRHLNSMEALSNISQECAMTQQNATCCQESAMMSSSPLPRDLSGSCHHNHHQLQYTKPRHTYKEPCSNPERCRNIKKKLLYGPSAEIHNAALSGTTIQSCAKCNNLKEYWVDSPSTTGSIPEDEVDMVLERLGNQQINSLDAVVIESENTLTAHAAEPDADGPRLPQEPTNLAVHTYPSCHSPPLLPPPDIHACVHNSPDHDPPTFTDHLVNQSPSEKCERHRNQHRHNLEAIDDKLIIQNEMTSCNKTTHNQSKTQGKLANVDLLQFNWQNSAENKHAVQNVGSKLGSAV